MSDSPATPATPSPEASWLRTHWDPEFLGRYEGSWIAVRGPEIIAFDTSLENLLGRTAWQLPLYAFVTFEPRV